MDKNNSPFDSFCQVHYGVWKTEKKVFVLKMSVLKYMKALSYLCNAGKSSIFGVKLLSFKATLWEACVWSLRTE